MTQNINSDAETTKTSSIYFEGATTIEDPSVKAGYTFTTWNLQGNGSELNGRTFIMGDEDAILTAQWKYNTIHVKIPQTLIGDSKGNSSFRVKCDDLKAGNIKVTVPNSLLYKQAGKTDITAAITAKSGNNTITPTNKVCVYDIATTNGLSAGCWQGSFNIGLTLTKE